MSSSAGSRFGRSPIRDGDDRKHINNFRPFLSHDSHSVRFGFFLLVTWLLSSVTHASGSIVVICHCYLSVSLKGVGTWSASSEIKNSDMDLQKWPISELRVKGPSGYNLFLRWVFPKVWSEMYNVHCLFVMTVPSSQGLYPPRPFFGSCTFTNSTCLPQRMPSIPGWFEWIENINGGCYLLISGLSYRI